MNVPSLSAHLPEGAISSDLAALSKLPATSSWWGTVEQVLPKNVADAVFATGKFTQQVVEPWASLEKVEVANTASYSTELVDISQGQSEMVPRTGEFHAGSPLRAELTETAKDIMLHSFQRDGREAGFIDLEKDMNRAEFVLQDSINGGSYAIGASGIEGDQAKAAVGAFQHFVGEENGDLANALARIMNQTMLSSLECIGSRSSRELPTKGIDVSHNKKFTDTGLKYYASAQAGNFGGQELSKVCYVLRKENDPTKESEYYVLEVTAATPCMAIFIPENRGDSEKECLAICSNENFKITQTTFCSYKVTPNLAFDSKSEIAEDNFPCFIECLKFFHNYRIDAKVMDNIIPNH